MDFAEQLEREFVRLVVDLTSQSGLSHSQFARTAFAADQSPVVKWRQIRNGSKGGRPQRLSMADASRCAEALGMYFPALCFQALENLRFQGSAAVASWPQDKKKRRAEPAAAMLREDKATLRGRTGAA